MFLKHLAQFLAPNPNLINASLPTVLDKDCDTDLPTCALRNAGPPGAKYGFA